MHKPHKILFITFLVLMIIPAIQRKFEIWKPKTLNGSFTLAHYEPLNTKKWLDGSFQEQYDKYLEDHIGFRTRFIRLINTIDFRLFRKSNAELVRLGKNDYLFEQRYINSYLGMDKIDDNILLDHVKRAKRVQDSLEARGVHFLVITAPGKGWYYPEYLPSKYNKVKKGISNYESVIEKFNVSGINYIDFNDLFMRMKDTVSYSLFPKCGVHWSINSMRYVVDSIINYAESNLKVDLPDLIIDSIDYTTKPRITDYDIGDALNMNYKIPQDTLAYPYFSFKNDSTKIKPKLLVIGDSFYWTFFNAQFAKELFDYNRFWYYNKEAFGALQLPFDYIDRKKEIEESDLVVIWSTEAAYHNFDLGFVNSYIDIIEGRYEKPKPIGTGREARIKYYISLIKNNSQWLSAVQDKAVERGIALEEMIRKDAEYMVDQEEKTGDKIGD